MNIAVLTAEGKVVVRPDTTRIKDSEDAYLPDFVNRVDWTPVIYTKIIKSGKCIAERFASRYFDSFNVGVLLFPADLADGSEQGYASASCMDRTSALNMQTANKIEVNTDPNKIVIRCNNGVIFSDYQDVETILTSAITKVSQICLLRIGDMLAVELQPRKELLKKGDGSPVITGYINEKEKLVFKVVL